MVSRPKGEKSERRIETVFLAGENGRGIAGQPFLNGAAALTHNELGKKMFVRLAQEEVKHLDTFSRLFSQVIQSDEWKKQVRREELKGPSPVIQELAERMKRAEGKSEVEALRIGRGLEQEAVDFFTASATKK